MLLRYSICRNAWFCDLHAKFDSPFSSFLFHFPLKDLSPQASITLYKPRGPPMFESASFKVLKNMTRDSLG
jgi:hypothetical protein